MAFSQQFLDELRARVGLADVVGRRVRLIRKGREFSGLCPFHNEKTPSFTVNEEKGFYHCFGCGAHGSVIDFVMQIDKLTFPEAVERLAGEAGMEVPRSSPQEREREERAKGLLDVVESACKFFERQLRLPDGKAAYDYLIRRGIQEEMIRRFRLGFAPDGRAALKAHLAREGVGEEMMIEAGLIIRPDDESRGAYDRFRGRVMFPIFDARGRVIAFGGRVMGQGEPKYLNSPETPLFHKGFNLYGLAQALPAIRDKGLAVVVEGYTDVIALHQAGIATAVAPLGTALTEDQLRLLWRHATEPILCFDGDAAGQRAAARAAERGLPILQPGKGLRFVELPAGEDPDTLVRSRGATAVAELLAAARPLSEIVWQIETRGRRIDTPEARAGLDARFRELTQRIADETVRRHYQSAFRGRVWDLYKQSRQSNATGRALMSRSVIVRTPIDQMELQGRILIGTLLSNPTLFDEVSEQFAALRFRSQSLADVQQAALDVLMQNPEITSAQLRNALDQRGFGDLLKDVTTNAAAEAAKSNRADFDKISAIELWDNVYELYLTHELESEVELAKNNATSERVEDHFERIAALKSELNHLKAKPIFSAASSGVIGLTDQNRLALQDLKSRGAEDFRKKASGDRRD